LGIGSILSENHTDCVGGENEIFLCFCLTKEFLQRKGESRIYQEIKLKALKEWIYHQKEWSQGGDFQYFWINERGQA